MSLVIEAPKLSEEEKRVNRHIALQEQAYMREYGPKPEAGKHFYYLGIVKLTPEHQTRAEVEEKWNQLIKGASFDWNHLPLIQGEDGREVVEFVSGQEYGSRISPTAQDAAVMIKESDIDIWASVQAVFIKP